MNGPKLKAVLAIPHPITGVYDPDHRLASEEIMAANVTVLASTLTGSEILNATDPAEFSALASTAELRDEWLNLCGVDSVKTTQGVGTYLESKIFGPGTTTRSNLQEARKQLKSVAEIEGLGEVGEGHVRYARSLP